MNMQFSIDSVLLKGPLTDPAGTHLIYGPVPVYKYSATSAEKGTNKPAELGELTKEPRHVKQNDLQINGD